MATWTAATVKPKKMGKVRCRCGVTGGAFWALWRGRVRGFTNLRGESIVFGNRNLPGDVWRTAPTQR